MVGARNCAECNRLVPGKRPTNSRYCTRKCSKLGAKKNTSAVSSVSSLAIEKVGGGRCAACRLDHPALQNISGVAVCPPCAFLELVHAEKLSLGDAIKALREKNLCAYCGEQATDVEHVVPRSSRLPTFTVPACRECNGIAWAHVFSSFEDKTAYIQRKLRHKYADILAMPEWDEAELRPLSYTLKTSIRAALKARDVMTQRLAWTWLSALLSRESP